MHFAAESHVDRSILGPDDFIRTNVVGTHALLKAAKALWIDRKDGARAPLSSCLDRRGVRILGPEDPPFHESSSVRAQLAVLGEQGRLRIILVRAYHETYGLDTTVTNCSNNYGPYQFPEKLIPLTIVNILLGKPLPVYGDGLQVRDWLHVEDHCAAISLALTRGEPGEVYNVGGNSETANIEIVRTLCALVDELSRRAGRLADSLSGIARRRTASRRSI